MNKIMNTEESKLEAQQEQLDIPVVSIEDLRKAYEIGRTDARISEREGRYYDTFDEWLFETFSAPTIAEVVMWLYMKHGIWITVNPNHSFKYWSVNIVTNKNANDNLHDATIFDSPTEAYKAAIEYTLNNLI